MASVNWLKMTTQKAGAMRMHNGREERVSITHSNQDIDKSKSHLNFTVGADDYINAYNQLRVRIEEEDAVNPPKKKTKDRITSFMLEAPMPQEIADLGNDEVHRFFEGLHGIYEDFFGKDNVCGSFVHLDEQHTYIDHKDVKMSLIHAHTLIAAYAEWTDDKGNERRGINGKNCSTKRRISELNKRIDSWVYDTYGIHYNNGNEARKQTVERLKAESMREEIKELQQERIEASYTPAKGIFKKKDEPTVTMLTSEYERLLELAESKSEQEKNKHILIQMEHEVKRRDESSRRLYEQTQEGIRNLKAAQADMRAEIQAEVEKEYKNILMKYQRQIAENKKFREKDWQAIEHTVRHSSLSRYEQDSLLEKLKKLLEQLFGKNLER